MSLPIGRIKAGVLALSVAGCTHMTSVASPADFLAAKRPARVWVTGPDDSVLLVRHPRLHGDTLSGFAYDRYFEIPIANVKLMRASVPAGGRTLLLAGAGAVALGVIVSQAHGQNGCAASASGSPPGEDEITPAC